MRGQSSGGNNSVNPFGVLPPMILFVAIILLFGYATVLVILPVLWIVFGIQMAWERRQEIWNHFKHN